MKKKRSGLRDWLLLCLLMAAALVLNSFAVMRTCENAVLIGTAGAFAVVLAAYALRGRQGRQLPWEQLALVAAVLVGFWFSLKLGYLYSSHDLGTYWADEESVYDGHLGYIYWFTQHPGFPAMNPMEGKLNSILYHPPLYYRIAALFMKLLGKLGLSKAVMLEDLQLVNLFFMGGTVICTKSICKSCGLKEKATAAVMLLVGCTPIMPLIAAVPNNDMLCAFLCTACAASALRWVDTRKTGWLCAAGLSLGFGMAAKMNAALLIPPLAVLFVAVFIRDQNRKSLLLPYGAFLALSVPEGIAWPLYHLIKFQMPLTYVRDPSGLESMAELSLWQRLGLPWGETLSSPFCGLNNAMDSNVWMTTLKTVVFDEEQLCGVDAHSCPFCWALLVLFGGILILGMVRLIRMMCSKRSTLAPEKKLFIGVLLLTFAVYYIRFCLQFPFVCTYNFRYLLPLLPLLMTGLWSVRGNKAKGWTGGLCMAALLLVCACYGKAAFFPA